MDSVQNTSSHSKKIEKNKITTKELVLISMFAAVLTIISQISIPMPSGVPITIQVFGVALVGIILGPKIGILSTLVYILIGAVGIPVFANFRGGLSVLTGVTGGYIVAWPVTAWFCGIRHNYSNKTLNYALTIFFSIIGVVFMEIIGGLQWAFLSGGDMTIYAIFIYSMTMFVPKDILITILAIIVGQQIRKPLIKAGLIS